VGFLSPDKLKQAQLEPVTALGPDREIRKDKKNSILIVMLCVFKMVQGRDSRTSGATCATVLNGGMRVSEWKKEKE
jgi:hypothetical protein